MSDKLKNTEKIDSNTQTTINHWDLDLSKNQPEPYHYGGKQNAGKILKVSADGFIRLGTGGGGGEPATYIKDITNASNVYTATKKDDTTIAWTIPDFTTGVASPKFTGTVSADNIVVSGDLTCATGTATTDIDFSNAKTFIIPHITLVDPATATSGTLTDSQLEILQSTDNAYILFNNEKYYLNDKEHTSGSLGYSHCGYESGEFKLKNITITTSTKGWVLTNGFVNPNHLYQHSIKTRITNGSTSHELNLTFCLFNDDASPYENAEGLMNALQDIDIPPSGEVILIASGHIIISSKAAIISSILFTSSDFIVTYVDENGNINNENFDWTSATYFSTVTDTTIKLR